MAQPIRLAGIKAASASSQLPEPINQTSWQYALASPGPPQQQELGRLSLAATEISRSGLGLHAGHGLTYRNVRPIAHIREMHELNIGHSIVARALMVGMQTAVREMAQLISV